MCIFTFSVSFVRSVEFQNLIHYSDMPHHSKRDKSDCFYEKKYTPSIKRKSDRFYDKKFSPTIPGEFSISHFADSVLPQGSGRLKKSYCNGLVTTQKSATGAELEEELEELSLCENEFKRKPRKFGTGKNTGGMKSKEYKNRYQPKNVGEANRRDRQRRDSRIYPVDLWFLVGDYIAPTEVKVFSLICRASYHVTTTPMFWKSLYRRFVETTKNVELPKELQRHCLKKHIGLKTAVVRALHLCYTPLINRENSLKHDPKSLVGMQCRRMWKEKSPAQQWVYKFQLGVNNAVHSRFKQKQISSRTCPADQFADIEENPNVGCFLLTITSNHYIFGPCVESMRLHTLSWNKSFVCLEFSSSPLSSSPSTIDLVTLTFSLSSPLKVHPWWFQAYHQPSNKESSLCKLS